MHYKNKIDEWGCVINYTATWRTTSQWQRERLIRLNLQPVQQKEETSKWTERKFSNVVAATSHHAPLSQVYCDADSRLEKVQKLTTCFTRWHRSQRSRPHSHLHEENTRLLVQCSGVRFSSSQSIGVTFSFTSSSDALSVVLFALKSLITLSSSEKTPLFQVFPTFIWSCRETTLLVNMVQPIPVW